MADIPALPFDIIEPAMPPAPPPDYSWAMLIAALALLALLAWAGVHWARTRRRRLGRRRLKQAQQAFSAGQLSAREAAFAVADALRTGLGLQRITAAASRDARWHAFVQRLDRLRYDAAADPSELGPLFAEAASWLRGKAPC